MKFVFSDIAKAIRWSVSLGGKLLRVVPGHTFLAVISNVLSQFCLLVGFLLPLKVVLLLGSDDVPGYFPGFLQSMGHDALIIILSAASVVFYLMHLITGKVVEHSASMGSAGLLQKSKKMAIFENQEDIAFKGYQRFTQSMAAVCFVAICLVVMSVFYPKIAAVIVSYIAIAFIILGLAVSTSKKIQERVRSSIAGAARLLGSVGFLFSFGFIVIDHLWGDAPGLLLSVVSLLLSRQLFSRASNLIKDLYGLYAQKPQLLALFFHGHVFLAQGKGSEKGVWGLIRPDVRDRWLREVLESSLEQPVTGFSVRWLDLGVQDVICYEIGVTCGGTTKLVLVKLFNYNRSAWAKHEATLITSQPDLPALPLLGFTMVDGLHCHVFDATGFSCCGNDEIKKATTDFRQELAFLAPSEELKAVYTRSRPLVWQRFDGDLLFRMQYLLDSKERVSEIVHFHEILKDIQQALAKLPLAINSLDLRLGMLWKNGDNKYFSGHWARWELEPLGSSWPFGDETDRRRNQLLDNAKLCRADVEPVVVPEVRLAALFSAFEIRLQRGRYEAAYDLISPMLSAYDAING